MSDRIKYFLSFYLLQVCLTSSAQTDIPVLPYPVQTAKTADIPSVYNGNSFNSLPLMQTFPGLPSSGRNGSFLGEEVTDLGDVNGDGYDDWALGLKHGATYPSGEKLGKVYVYFGGINLINEKDPDLILYGENDSDRFGFSVSSAGDVNNDGFDDIIAGASWNSSVNLFTGRAYLFLGGSEMDNVPDLFFDGEELYDYFGYSVSSAGDVNADGFDDLIVGAHYNSAGGVNAGRAYLYYGGTGMDNIADLIFTGESQEDYFGNSVSAAGDVNNDGFSDIIIGAYLNNAADVDAGRAYIYYGGLPMNNVADVILTGNVFLGKFGTSVSSAGDVNNDGYSDVIVGAGSAGMAFIYFGNAGMDEVPDVVFTTEFLYDYFGTDVSSAGDVNGDGFSDVIVGASSGGTNVEGNAYLYLGGVNMNNTPDAVFNGEAQFDNFGVKVSSAGDINSDGFSDLIVGADWNSAGGYSAGRTYIYFGGKEVNSEPDIILTGEGAYDNIGNSVSSAGDVNNDGFDDILVGAYLNDAGGSDAGCAYLYFGGIVTDNKPDVIFLGEEISDDFGISVSSAGDVNNDGYADVVVGAYANSYAGMAAGRAYIFLGGVNMDNVPDVILSGEAGFDFFGNSVSSAGDVNNDGFDDVIIGAYSNETRAYEAGSAYIYFGGNSMDNVPDVVFRGEAALDYFGYSVSGAGDVNNDGYSDVIIGAYMNDAGGEDAGKAYIFFGGTVVDSTADIILTGEASLIRFGYSVSGAGDVNNDGFDDVIAGAYLAGNNGEGKAYIYLGGQSMNNIPDKIFFGESFGDAFGISVNAGGDINKDGFSDIIIGAPTSSAGSYSAGRVYIYFGGANMNTSADGIFTGDASSDFFGNSAAHAGDINNDGFSDIVIGAPGNCAVGFKMGKAYLFAGGSVIMDSEVNKNKIPGDYSLLQNYPNPFNPSTTVLFILPERSFIKLRVFDILGREIAVLYEGEKGFGTHSVQWNGTDKFQNNVSSGVYFIQLETPAYNKTIKTVLTK